VDLLRFITCGSVDDGKSTLIGRLLYDSQAVSLDILDAIQRQSKNKNDGELDLSLLTDGLRSEREQGITIDVAYKYFTTSKRKFIIADAPGHTQYTRNMITGASSVDAAIVLIDARQGVVEQTTRHSLIASLLGIKHIIVAVNKMDMVEYSEAVFDKIEANYKVLAAKLSIENVFFIPISALLGDNIVEKSSKMSWYLGTTLLDFLEKVEVIQPNRNADSRFQVQYVIRPHTDELHDYRGYAGKILSGNFHVGDRVVCLPSGIETSISAIEINQKQVQIAQSQQPVVLHLEDDIDISRGDSLVVVSSEQQPNGVPFIAPHVSREIEATLCWFEEKTPLKVGNRYLLQQNANLIKASIKGIDYRLEVSTLEKTATEKATLNDIVKVKIHTAQPLVFDDYLQNKSTGSFILVHEQTGNTVAAGMIDMNGNWGEEWAYSI
jgi:sulfate adenylyltransferase subunit 1